ncbi:MAG: SMC family ATPase [Candidatus ainarchaeum sp.]|nr:SMC family ATPase [Candidatus ainarchaeum sp.]
MIRRLALRNWKSHAETSLEFGKGTNILVGIMGSGKSSLLEGIAFALFGTFPNAHRKSVRLADVITSRPEEKDSAEAELSFDWDGAEYSVRREIRRKGPGEAELRRNGALVAVEPEKVTAEIERLLKVDYALFYRAIYAEQNRMDYFLTLDPRERKRQFDELLGIDKFEVARANAGTAVGCLKRAKEEAERQVAGTDFAALAARAEGAGKAAAEAESALAAAVSGLASEKEAGKRLRAEFSGLERAKKGWDALQEERAGLEHSEKMLRADAERRRNSAGGAPGGAAEAGRAAREAEESEAKAKAGLKANSLLVMALREKDASLRRGLSELEALEKKKAELEAFLAGAEGGAAGAGARAAGLKARREEILGSLADASARKRVCESALAGLGSAGCSCPVCNREIDEGLRGKLCGEREREAAGLEARASGLRKALAACEQELLASEKAFRDAEFAEKRALELGDVRAGLDAARAQVSENGRMLSGAAGQTASLESALESRSAASRSLRERLAFLRELELVESRLAAVSGELESVRRRAAGTEFDAAVFEAARKRLEESAKKEIALEGTARLLSAKCETLRERLASDEKELRALSEKKAEAERFSSALELAMQIQAALVETQASLRAELIEAVNETMAGIWPSVYPYADYSAVRIEASETDYLVEVRAGDAWIPVEGFASGGERACALLALRIAFAMVMAPNLRWLVLDEPTHNLDRNGIKALVEALRERIPSIVEQVFVITHDESLREAASARLYRLERDKEGAGPTVVADLA